MDALSALLLRHSFAISFIAHTSFPTTVLNYHLCFDEFATLSEASSFVWELSCVRWSRASVRYWAFVISIMRLPQRFKRVPLQDFGTDEVEQSPFDAPQTKLDAKNDIEARCNEIKHTDTEYIGGPPSNMRYTVIHPKTRIEEIEEFERRRFGTRFISLIYDNVLAGWRAGLLRSFTFSLAALLINIAVFLWLFFKFRTNGGIGLIRTSNCGEIGAMQTAIKVGLNVISTLILGASTYAMQGTTSPTREEVDKAHSKGKWLEIGTQSWRNLLYVSRKHAALWSVLALTSLPLHLM